MKPQTHARRERTECEEKAPPPTTKKGAPVPRSALFCLSL